MGNDPELEPYDRARLSLIGGENDQKGEELVRGEPVANTGFGQQVAGASRVHLQFAPELGHVDAEVVCLVGVRGAPHVKEELAMGQDLASVADERGQQPVFDWRQVYLAPKDGHLPLGKVHMQIAERECRLDGVILAGRMTQGCPHARKQFPDPEGLAHIVIGAGVQGGDLVLFLPPCRQHNDGQDSPFTEPPDDLEPVDVRKAEVENHDVGLARCRLDKAGLPRGRLKQAVSVTPQGHPEEPSDLGIVFDDKDDWSRFGRRGGIRGPRGLGGRTRFKQFRASPVGTL